MTTKVTVKKNKLCITLDALDLHSKDGHGFALGLASRVRVFGG